MVHQVFDCARVGGSAAEEGVMTAAWGLTWSGRKHLATDRPAVLPALPGQVIAACNGNTYVYPESYDRIPGHLRDLVDAPVCKRCAKRAAKDGAA